MSANDPKRTLNKWTPVAVLGPYQSTRFSQYDVVCCDFGEDSHMLKFPLALVAVHGALLTLATPTTAQTFPTNLPTAIVCYNPQDKSWHVGHLSSVRASGDALYLSGNSRLSATVNSKGLVVTPTAAALDCFEKPG